ncbi:MAG: hypothetical protein AB8B63_17030 [Granulosicoccus sp.]
MSVKYLCSIHSLLITLLLPLQVSSSWALTNIKPAEQTLTASRYGNLSGTVDDVNILFVRGLPDPIRKEVSLAISENFNTLQVQQIDATEFNSTTYHWPDVDIIVAAGSPGCEVALKADVSTRTLCTLLTKESFFALNETKQTDSSRRIEALVIDQPVSRQALVASSVYPALNLFTGFHTTGTQGQRTVTSGDRLESIPFKPNTALSTQLREAIKKRDALVATSDSRIFNTSTLSTVLLTAYGFGKPVIGFSRAYVKAGALITCYSTPSMIMQQVAENIASGDFRDTSNATLVYPKFFAILDNPSVARSLSLIKAFRFTAERAYQDMDFAL